LKLARDGSASVAKYNSNMVTTSVHSQWWWLSKDLVVLSRRWPTCSCEAHIRDANVAEVDDMQLALVKVKQPVDRDVLTSTSYRGSLPWCIDGRWRLQEAQGKAVLMHSVM
jgi:hypothetical protein